MTKDTRMYHLFFVIHGNRMFFYRKEYSHIYLKDSGSELGKHGKAQYVQILSEINAHVGMYIGNSIDQSCSKRTTDSYCSSGLRISASLSFG